MPFPETIQALVYTKAGGPEVIDKVTLPFPKPAADEVLVKVRHVPRIAGVHHVDCEHTRLCTVA